MPLDQLLLGWGIIDSSQMLISKVRNIFPPHTNTQGSRIASIAATQIISNHVQLISRISATKHVCAPQQGLDQSKQG
jgi:hypothetical protein